MTYSQEQINSAIVYALGKLGVENLKDKQQEAVEAFVNESDTFVSLPTGYGKSLCYSILPLVFDSLRGTTGRSIVICVSPLTALMMDQRRQYAPRGLATEIVTFRRAIKLQITETSPCARVSRKAVCGPETNP